MNLGSFAGGVAQGMQSAQRTQIAQQESADNRSLRDRGMKIQESEEGRKQAASARDDAFRSEMQAIGEEFPAGGPPENEPKYLAKYALAQARHSGMTPEMRNSIAKATIESAKTPFTMSMNKLLGGDPAGVAEVLKHIGREDPAAVLDSRMREGVLQIKMSDGKNIDLRGPAARFGTTALAAQLDSNIATLMKEANSIAGTKNLGAQADEHTARAAAVGAEAPAKLAEVKSRTNLNNANAGKAAATTQGAVSDRANAQMTADIKAVVPKDVDGKTGDPAAIQYVMGRAVHLRSQDGKMLPKAAVAAAANEWRSVAAQADARISALKKAKRKPAEFGAGDWDSVRSQSILQQLSKNQQASVSSPAIAPAVDFEAAQ